ncbi:MAG: anhydro-N-acetylmuramic acid kinase [Methylomonas sp.]
MNRKSPETNAAPELFIGLMSGTSLDGIDAGLVEFSGGQARLIDFYYQAYSEELREQIQAISQADQAVLLKDYGFLDCRLGCLFAEATQALLAKAAMPADRILAIGSHGQTVYHAPDSQFGFSLQIGDPNRIAELTGITTISDFRRRDIAVGGQGAPLAPAFHQAVFADRQQPRAVVNIGGIANITLLDGEQAAGFDTGPGNTLLDFWRRRHSGQAYDHNGDWAAGGEVDTGLLNILKDDDYLRLPPPKSTGKEYFSAFWLEQKLASFRNLTPVDVQTTLTKFSADCITDAIKQYAARTELTLVCGGGAHNRTLLKFMTDNLPCPLASTEIFGIHPDHIEAMAFAWLARQTLNALPGNITGVTGARKPVVLGGVYLGNAHR